MNDPVIARRARIARAANLGKRVGYLALLVAIAAFAAWLLLPLAAERFLA